MKAEKWFTAFWAALLAFLMAFGGVACLVTGFGFSTVDLASIAWWTAAAALVSVLVFTVEAIRSAPSSANGEAAAQNGASKAGWIGVLILAVVLLYFWWTGALSMSLETLLFAITRFYDNAYHCGTVRWTEDILLESDMQLCLVLIAMVIAFLVSGMLCRRRLGIGTMFAAVLPVAACLVVTDTVPEIWCLTLFLAAAAMVLLTHTVRRQSERRANRLTAALLIPVWLILSLLFYASPPATYKGQDRADEITNYFLGIYEEVKEVLGGTGSFGSVGYGTSPDSVSLTGIGPRTRLQLVVMDVTASYSGTVYLRSKAYDTYTGLSWTASDGVWNQDGAGNWYGYGADAGTENIRITTRRVRPNIFMPYYCTDADVYRSMYQGQIVNSNEKTQYAFSVVPAPSFEGEWWKALDYSRYLQGVIITGYDQDEPDRMGELLDSLSDYPAAQLPALSDQYTTLPEGTQHDAGQILYRDLYDAFTAYQLAKSETGGDSSASWQNYALKQRELAVAIADYVRASAAYDLKTQRMPEDETDFALWFLEDSDTGYCVHFASAATVLLRAAGIDARYVEGYTADVREGKEVSVREERAHAWVEYYQLGVGWVVLEATPASEEEEPETAPDETTEPVTEPEQTTAPPESTAPSETNTEPQTTHPDVTTDIGTQPTTTGTQAPRADLTWLWNVLKALLMGCAVLGAALGQRQLRLSLLRKRFRKGNSKAQALARWREIERLSRMTKTEPADDLLSLARKAKFSQHEMVPEELSRLDEAVESLRDRLKEQTLSKRLWYCIVRGAY